MAGVVNLACVPMELLTNVSTDASDLWHRSQRWAVDFAVNRTRGLEPIIRYNIADASLGRALPVVRLDAVLFDAMAAQSPPCKPSVCAAGE